MKTGGGESKWRAENEEEGNPGFKRAQKRGDRALDRMGPSDAEAQPLRGFYPVGLGGKLTLE